jgi:putative SOS response-associated peptidase YedK
LTTLFDLADEPVIVERYNSAPAQDVAVVRQAKDGTRTLAMLRWGLVPFWARQPDEGHINARAETADRLPVFEHAFRFGRCLIPADGFYEWAARNSKRQPFHFHLSSDRPFAFAGLCDRWEGTDGAALETCAILTTEANAVVQPVHDRMPVLLDQADFGPWLDPKAKLRDRKALLRPYAGDDLEVVAVSTWVNNAKHEGARCLKPVVHQPGLWDTEG